MIFSVSGERKIYETKEDIETLVKRIEKDIGSITGVNLKDNVFKPAVIQRLFGVIREIKNLTDIILTSCFTALPPEEMRECLKVISKNLKPSRIQYFELNDSALSCDIPSEFLDLIGRMENLCVLRLANCGLGSGGGALIADALSRIEKKDNLISVDFSTNRLESSGPVLGEALSKFENLEEVRIAFNSVDRDSMFVFLDSFKNNSLKVLDIRDNLLSPEGCKLLGEYFAAWDVGEIRIGDCLMEDDGLKKFIGAAITKGIYVNVHGGFYTGPMRINLDISYNHITDDVLGRLKEFLEKIPIGCLWIFGNALKDPSELVSIVNKKGGIIYLEEDEDDDVNASLLLKFNEI
jgi:Ran GTPase-activating protein 1